MEEMVMVAVGLAVAASVVGALVVVDQARVEEARRAAQAQAAAHEAEVRAALNLVQRLWVWTLGSNS